MYIYVYILHRKLKEIYCRETKSFFYYAFMERPLCTLHDSRLLEIGSIQPFQRVSCAHL